MSLYAALEMKVNQGELTWSQILSEVHAIKKERNPKSLSEILSLESFRNEDELGIYPHRAANPFQLTARKEIIEKMSPPAKVIMDIISEDFNSGKSCTKASWYKSVRKHMKRSQILKAKRELLKVARALSEIEEVYGT